MKPHSPAGRNRLTPSTLHSALVAGALAATLTQAPPVLAQSGALEEIVVTARKRDESLQDTPVAITAFSGNRLQESGITNLADFNRIVPNVDVQAGSGTAGAANGYSRGGGQRDAERTLHSGVDSSLDGVSVGR